MIGRASRSEYRVAARSVRSAARGAEREIRRRSVDERYFDTEEWLHWALRHGDLVGDALRRDAESVLVARFGLVLWVGLGALVPWWALPDLHQDALVALLAVLRDGPDDWWGIRRRILRHLAHEVWVEYSLGPDGPLADACA